jgi:predicted nucleotidyltransferase
VRAILARIVPEATVWAFGSRVHGRNLKPFSDLDLAIVEGKRLAPGAMVGLKAAFADSDLPFRVDLVELDSVDDAFRERIEAEHRQVRP